MLSKITSLIVIFLLILLIALNCYYSKKNEELTNFKLSRIKEEFKKENGLLSPFDLNTSNIVNSYDKKMLIDPFTAPRNRMENDVISDLNVYQNFNQSTHGKLNNYHVIGVLNLSNKTPDIDKIGPFDQKDIKNNATFDNNVLQLYGRQKYPRGREYEYYTVITSGNQTIKIPLYSKNKQELYDGDELFIKELNKYYIVSKYPTEEIEYIPY